MRRRPLEAVRLGARDAKRAGWLALAVSALVIGCSSPTKSHDVEAPTRHAVGRPMLAEPPGKSSLPVDVAAPTVAPPLADSSAVVEALDVPGYLPSVVVVPPRAPAPSPVLVVTHGAGGRPEPDCARYQELTRGAAFVLCTRGRATNTHLPVEQRGYFYDGHIELGREMMAALEALSEHYAGRLDASGITFAGYSQGASMGILFLQQGGARDAHVRRILLVEGGFADWNIAVSEKLKASGVEKIAIVCGQVRCRESADRSIGWIRRAGIEVETRYANGAGHTSGGGVKPLVDEVWEWLR